MIITRFAPSPTGLLHLGSARTALFNYLFAKKKGGKFYLRIEDTDYARSTKESEVDILTGLKWLGIEYDNNIIYQSKNQSRYQAIIKQLLLKGIAYYCFCNKDSKEKCMCYEKLNLIPLTSREHLQNKLININKKQYELLSNSKNNATIRVRFPKEGQIFLQDLIQKKICWENKNFEDFAIARSDGSATYMLAVVVDDHDMNVTHVIRGDDHLINTPKQLYLYQCLEWQPPQFAHIPLILGLDGSKLSKRKGDISINSYYKQGYLSQAIINLLLRLGWSHGNEEIISWQQAMQWFTLEKIQNSPAKFNPVKLDSLNKFYLKNSHNSEIINWIIENWQHSKNQKNAQLNTKEIARLNYIINKAKIRCTTLLELTNMISFITDNDTIDLSPELLRILKLELLESLYRKLNNIHWNLDSITTTLNDDPITNIRVTSEQLRIALTNTTVSVGVYDLLICLGHDSSLNRINHAIELLKNTIEKNTL